MSPSDFDEAGRRGAAGRPRVTPEIAAEAAVWVASLHGPGRNRAMEDEFRAWQARSPAHREAFERTTDVWQDIPSIKLADAYAAAHPRSSEPEAGRAQGGNRRRAVAAGLAVFLAGGGVLFQKWREQGGYGTAIGEQRLVMLEDGTRLLLNTHTHVRVDYGPKQRTVDVRGGEALFEVAKDAARPFVVRVAGSEVVALGTAFSVKYIDGPKTADSLTVTLIEGRVNVRPAAGAVTAGLAPAAAVVLHSGDRLMLGRDAAGATVVRTRMDRPDIERAMAWQRQEAVFDDTSLVDAVAEINRYSRTQVELSKSWREQDRVC